MTKVWKTLLVLTVISAGLFSATSLAINSVDLDVTGMGMDTIAGSPTILTTSKTSPNTKVTFEVGKPDGSAIDVVGITDSTGVASVMFSGENTKMAGLYAVRTKIEDNPLSDAYTNFAVSAGPVSSTASKITPADQVVSYLSEKASVKVALVDDYGNPISGHMVRLISSASANEIISSSTNVSDTNGEIVFTVDSKQAGATIYTAYDVSADFVLEGKARVAYFNDSNVVLTNNIPSNYAFGSSGNASGLADHLAFEDVPMVINPGESVSFKITAYDVSDQVVMNYGSTVRFSVESGNSAYITLPTDYVFTPEDLGSHTFSVALAFQQPGSYQLRAQDTLTDAVYGQFIFVVGSGGAMTGSVNIASPITGTYSNNVQVISGTATPGAKLKVFDGDIELTYLLADISGSFSYTTGLLTDGLHRFSVAEVTEVGTILSTSPVVEVTVYTGGVDLSNVVIEPSNTVDAGTSVTVKATATGKLSKASLVLAENIYELTADAQGNYVAQIPAPLEPGNYPMTFVIKDELGNESTVENKGVLTVNGALPAAAAVVPDVTGLIATTEGKRVILNWNEVVGSTNPIKNYRVYVGPSPVDLSRAIDTFTNATTWYIPNLENGTEYHFAVVAVDSLGNTSLYLSNMVAATPNPLILEVPDLDVELGMGGEDAEIAIEEMETETSETGPEILWLVLVSAIGGICYSETARRRKV